MYKPLRCIHLKMTYICGSVLHSPVFANYVVSVTLPLQLGHVEVVHIAIM